MFNFLRNKTEFFAIGAIFRNEKEYILEWLAWHQSQGFNKFIIYDNHSDDGTTELLRTLEDKNIIDLYHIKQQENVQLIAYEKIVKDYQKKVELLAFIDADEFLMPQDEKLVVNHFKELFKNKNIGAVGINWRNFGTNHHQTKQPGNVIEDYTLAGNDSRKRNHFIKSVYRPKAVKKIFPHRAVLAKGFQYINTANEELIFSTYDSNLTPTKSNQTSGVSATICNERLRVNHYALKSIEEFINKKKSKGSATQGADHVKSDSYLKEFDLNDETHKINPTFLENFLVKLSRLKSDLSL